MLRKAVLEDIPQIMDIINVSILEMHSYQNYQWDKNYPQISDFQADIEAEDLYVFERDGNLAALICVNYVEPDEYSDLKWSSPQKRMVIHRMSVHPEYRRTGLGSELMKFAEILARSRGCPYIRTDTNSKNEKMKTLFTKFGYTFIGEVNFPRKETPFYCYDKILD
jgi:ribosomal protein S18 acetylase RimI-like enzyme